MAYMSKEARGAAIMETAVAIVMRDGLACATVRGIAQALECSPGQIHHHFASVDDLRAGAIRELWLRLEPKLTEDLLKLPPRARLLVQLSGCAARRSDESDSYHAIAGRLWREAWEIRGEGPVRDAVAEGIAHWHAGLSQTLAEGVRTGVFPVGLNVADVARRLLSAALGYDLLSGLNPCAGFQLPQADFAEGLLIREGL